MIEEYIYSQILPHMQQNDQYQKMFDSMQQKVKSMHLAVQKYKIWDVLKQLENTLVYLCIDLFSMALFFFEAYQNVCNVKNVNKISFQKRKPIINSLSNIVINLHYIFRSKKTVLLCPQNSEYTPSFQSGLWGPMMRKSLPQQQQSQKQYYREQINNIVYQYMQPIIAHININKKYKSISLQKVPWINRELLRKNPCSAQLAYYSKNNYICLSWQPECLQMVPLGKYILGINIFELNRVTLYPGIDYFTQQKLKDLQSSPQYSSPSYAYFQKQIKINKIYDQLIEKFLKINPQYNITDTKGNLNNQDKENNQMHLSEQARSQIVQEFFENLTQQNQSFLQLFQYSSSCLLYDFENLKQNNKFKKEFIYRYFSIDQIIIWFLQKHGKKFILTQQTSIKIRKQAEKVFHLYRIQNQLIDKIIATYLIFKFHPIVNLSKQLQQKLTRNIIKQSKIPEGQQLKFIQANYKKDKQNQAVFIHRIFESRIDNFLPNYKQVKQLKQNPIIQWSTATSVGSKKQILKKTIQNVTKVLFGNIEKEQNSDDQDIQQY